MTIASGVTIGLGGGTTVGMAVPGRLGFGVPGSDGRVGLVPIDLLDQGLFGDVVEFLDPLDDRFRIFESGVDFPFQVQGKPGGVVIFLTLPDCRY